MNEIRGISLVLVILIGGCGNRIDQLSDNGTSDPLGDDPYASDLELLHPEDVNPDIRDTVDTWDGWAFDLDPGLMELSDLAVNADLMSESVLAADTHDSALDATDDSTAPVTSMEFELWTFNLLNPANPFSDAGDVNKRTQIVIDAIEEHQPDLVALQEVVDSFLVPNRAEFIAQATGYEWAWQLEYSVVLYDEGIAILSKWPIIETSSIELPHKDLVLFTRYVLGVRVDTPVGETDFYCTHMTVGGTESQSADQAKAAFEFITEESAGVPAFFAGDLNAEPDTLAMRFLRGESMHDLVKGDFTDGWMATNPDDPGWTIDSSDPHDRIDYIYIAATASENPEPVSCELLFQEPVDGVLASDHIGVSCIVEMAPVAP